MFEKGLPSSRSMISQFVPSWLRAAALLHSSSLEDFGKRRPGREPLRLQLNRYARIGLTHRIYDAVQVQRLGWVRRLPAHEQHRHPDPASAAAAVAELLRLCS